MMIENVRSKGLEMCRPTLLPESQRKADIKGLFDPIYFKEANVWNLSNKPQKQVVTNDITFDENAGFYLLTGANNGGKTTFVRAVGICQVMAQAGLYVPASSCEISLVDCVYNISQGRTGRYRRQPFHYRGKGIQGDKRLYKSQPAFNERIHTKHHAAGMYRHSRSAYAHFLHYRCKRHFATHLTRLQRRRLILIPTLSLTQEPKA
ncbi:MAG: MutS-related protein [[Eubacterium] siraeum]